jgi:alpha 1,3-glucosidase
MVTIVDPHVKRDSNYYVYKEASEKKYFVRTKDGTEFDGWCWPGAGSCAS